jgi:hypothetical protein
MIQTYDLSSHNVGDPDFCGKIIEACFISREKMDFLYTDAFVCKYIKVCRLATVSLSLLFTRYIVYFLTYVLLNEGLKRYFIKKNLASLKKCHTHKHARTHARTHTQTYARTHAHTHTHPERHLARTHTRIHVRNKHFA